MHALETSRLLTEEYSAKILLATMGKPKTAFELSEKLGVPIAACYRKIKILEDRDYIFCVDGAYPGRKMMSLYKSNVKNARIMFERNKIRANIEIDRRYDPGHILRYRHVRVHGHGQAAGLISRDRQSYHFLKRAGVPANGIQRRHGRERCSIGRQDARG